ncbi:MAG: histidine kinase [Actinomycetota bacterium]|nr:histidine kinase [Actinomycetota bacterium]
MTRRELLRDATLPVAIALLGTVELYDLKAAGWGTGIALEWLACLLLIGRRLHPLALCAAAAVVTLAMPWFGPQLDDPATPILILVLATFSLARQIRGLHGLIGMAVIALMLSADYLLIDQRDHGLSDIVFVSALLIPPFVLGRLMRRLAEQSAQLLRRQDWVKQEAIRAERDRIARDLHDVIAHSLSAIVVQTAAAEDLVWTDPARAARAMKVVADTGRRALSETGHLLHVIRDDTNELGLAPAPGLARLPELVESFRANGLSIDLKLEGPMTALPIGVDLSAYRVVQETLTNALKYASDKTSTLSLVSTRTQLLIHAENSVNGAKADGSGLGLAGMAERVSIFGGSLSHGLTDAGRFELTAVFPVNHGGSS